MRQAHKAHACLRQTCRSYRTLRRHPSPETPNPSLIDFFDPKYQHTPIRRSTALQSLSATLRKQLLLRSMTVALHCGNTPPAVQIRTRRSPVTASPYVSRNRLRMSNPSVTQNLTHASLITRFSDYADPRQTPGHHAYHPQLCHTRAATSKHTTSCRRGGVPAPPKACPPRQSDAPARRGRRGSSP